MKISICNELFQGWPIEEVFAYVARLGYNGVEIAPYTLADSVTDISPRRRRQIKEAAGKCRIEIVGLHWLLVESEGLHISHPDEFIRIKTQEYIEALIHFCADIGGKMLLHGSPHQRTIHEDWGFEECWDFAKQTFKVCLRVASKRNVTYCIEPLLRASTNFVNTVEDAIRFVREMNHPQFQMMFDCRNACAEERTAATALVRALTSGHLRHIHVNDADGSGPGCGDMKFLPLLKILLENRYRGYLSVEVAGSDPDPKTVASTSIGYLKGLMEPFLNCA